jgi:hypothetical protein
LTSPSITPTGISFDTPYRLEETEAKIYNARQDLIALIKEINSLLADKTITIRSQEYLSLKDQYYHLKQTIRSLQQSK